MLSALKNRTILNRFLKYLTRLESLVKVFLLYAVHFKLIYTVKFVQVDFL